MKIPNATPSKPNVFFLHNFLKLKKANLQTSPICNKPLKKENNTLNDIIY